MSRRAGSRLVYSSDQGRVCPHCGLAAARCVCRRSPHAARGDGVVRVRRETRGRRGKTVTTISGIPLAEQELRDLAAQLKRRCGSGGSVVEGVIEVQGDHGDAIVPELEARGYTVERGRG